MPMQVELVSPERILFSGEADMVICRTVGGGDIAFLSGHAPFLGALAIWPARIKRTDGTEEAAAVHGGFVHVRDDTVIILSDVAELASQIDVERARRAKEAAEAKAREVDDADAQAALQRAIVRIDVAGG
jgi:F-type H+-transporting ATPase subunit epsilon